MYLDYLVDIPEVKGKITFRSKGSARYVYYECDRTYDPSKKYTIVKRVTIGKVSTDDESKMRPNENFKKYFPEVESPEERFETGRSSCLRAGAYMVINKVVKDIELDKIHLCMPQIQKRDTCTSIIVLQKLRENVQG
nr:hypothetical protein [Eubacterium ramulus]